MALAQLIVLAISGMLLGLRFRIPMLLVASVACLLFVGGDSFARGEGFLYSLMAIVFSLSSLQGGYLVGVMLVSPTLKPQTTSSRLAATHRAAH
jgi:hypothetical protein